MDNSSPNNLKGQIKVLLAEDDKFISRAYKDGLSRAGFLVVPAMDGAEAFLKAKESIPDIILLDLIMPLKNGFEVLEEIKADSDLKKIPVIVLSNLGQETDIDKARMLGAADYMIKSNFSMKEIIEKINKVLEK
jgi:DNA-binding response OmpR family regulator